MASARQWLQDLLGRSSGEAAFDCKPDSTGLNFQLEESVMAELKAGKGGELAQVQWAFLQQLEEEGLAEPIFSGHAVSSQNAVRLERDLADVLGLPAGFSGHFIAKVTGNTRQAAFDVRLSAVLENGEVVQQFALKGPLLSLSSTENYLLNPGQYSALSAVAQHTAGRREGPVEEINLQLVHTLQQAKQLGFTADLSHFDDLTIHVPPKVGLTVVEEDDGGLTLTPNLNCGVAPDKVAAGIGQALVSDDAGSVRVGDEIILLDEKAVSAVRHVLERRHIPAEEASDFLNSPTMYLDSAIIDLDDGFSKRVKGAGVYTFCDFGSDDQQSMNWIGQSGSAAIKSALDDLLQSTEDQKRLSETVQRAIEQGADCVTYEGTTLPISPEFDVQGYVDSYVFQRDPVDQEAQDQPEKEEKLTTNTAAVVLNELTEVSVTQMPKRSDLVIDENNLARTPYPHQEEGIRWIYSLRETDGTLGGLLADDMGLGKTYMTLVALQQWMLNSTSDSLLKPSLIVAPLALLENWEEEVSLTFKNSPFKDIVVLQSARDLTRFRVKGAGKETVQSVDEDSVLAKDEIRYSLKIGSNYANNRLDQPGRLVITTFHALASYQFSLCRVDWDFVVFDEAQNLKNLNTLQTRAAKGLKADFKLLATGTPVENSLSDFWCLMDTAQPGLLGDWKEFNENYIRPIAIADKTELNSVRLEIGKGLRAKVGSLMLRRLKEDTLVGLPKKTIYSGRDNQEFERVLYDQKLATVLKGRQLAAYDGVIEAVHKNSGDAAGAMLKALAELRAVSIHPNARDSTKGDAAAWGDASVKIGVIEELLRDIQHRNEKVIVFLLNKMLQVRLKRWIETKFSVQVDIVNGDTKATAKDARVITRKRIVDNFQTGSGFGVLIMSPIAAGVGLTITGANNVIHLERHWNPAKEAQATDRVYRIGATRDVNVYLPIVHHPEFDSFEVTLDRLLNRKIDLKDAVMTLDDVDRSQFQP